MNVKAPSLSRSLRRRLPVLLQGISRIIERLQISATGRDCRLYSQKAPVKKTFKLNIEGKNRDRLLEATKHEIRKYVKRQRRVPLPAGVDYWDFDCKFGTSEDVATVVHFATITALIDGVASAGGEAFYLELLAKEGHRTARPVSNRADISEHLDD